MKLVCSLVVILVTLSLLECRSHKKGIPQNKSSRNMNKSSEEKNNQGKWLQNNNQRSSNENGNSNSNESENGSQSSQRQKNSDMKKLNGGQGPLSNAGGGQPMQGQNEVGMSSHPRAGPNTNFKLGKLWQEQGQWQGQGGGQGQWQKPNEWEVQNGGRGQGKGNNQGGSQEQMLSNTGAQKQNWNNKGNSGNLNRQKQNQQDSSSSEEQVRPSLKDQQRPYRGWQGKSPASSEEQNNSAMGKNNKNQDNWSFEIRKVGSMAVKHSSGEVQGRFLENQQGMRAQSSSSESQERAQNGASSNRILKSS